MKEYLFRTLISDGEQDMHTRYVHIEAESITSARKKFREKMKEEEGRGDVAEWCLLAVYRAL